MRTEETLLQIDSLILLSTMKRRSHWVFTLFCVLLQACSDHQRDQPPTVSDQLISNWSDVIEQIEWPDSVHSLNMPEDVRLHPEAPFESFISRVVLHGVGEQFDDQALDGIFFELDRIRDSRWSYRTGTRSQIIRSQSEFAEPVVKDQFARLALGLSESDKNTLSSGNTRITLQTPGHCRQTWTMSGHLDEGPFSLSAESDDCPVANNLGSLKQWEYQVMPLSGNIGGKQVRGHAWMMHRWGTPVSTRGPVVVDQLRLRIVESDEVPAQLTITRTKRRSGNGPMSVFATHRKRGIITELVDVRWNDEYQDTPKEEGSVSYPSSIRLQIIGQQELILDPVVTGSAEPDDIFTPWSTAVRVSGTHKGIGYLDFQPLSTY